MKGLLILVLALAAAPAGAQRLRVAQPNAAHFPEVVLYAYPTDARSLLLSGLTKESFRIRENGRPAEITDVQSGGGSLDVCLALDRSRSMREDVKFDYARLAAKEFIRQLAPQDRAAVVSFGEDCTLDQPLTRDGQALVAAIERAEPNGMATHFFDGVYWSINQVALRPLDAGAAGSVVGAGRARSEARRVVLALTDGNDNGSHVFFPRLIEYARANGVSVCTVALGRDADTTLLQHLAAEAGGVCLRAPSPQDLQQLYVALARELRREYRITMRSPRPERDGSRRELRVELHDTPLAANTWYQAPGQGSLLVTMPGSASPSESVGGAAATRIRPDNSLVLGALLVAIGLAVSLAALLTWLGSRGRTLPMRDSNPRMDLMPLRVQEGSTRVGRGSECEVILDSHEVSRLHARIEAAGGAFRLVDEGSANGTYVNGRRVRRSRVLRVGDVVRFGDREFRFEGPS